MDDEKVASHVVAALKTPAKSQHDAVKDALSWVQIAKELSLIEALENVYLPAGDVAPSEEEVQFAIKAAGAALDRLAEAAMAAINYRPV